MQNTSHAIHAYKSASRYRSYREQEADAFGHVSAALRRSRDAGPIQKIRAIADNRRLWMMVNDLMRDPLNALPDSLKASILSVGAAVRQEMDQETPDLDFLIDINENIALGLLGRP